MTGQDDALSALEQAEEMLTRAGESLREAAPQLVAEVERAKQRVIDELVTRERERLLRGEAA
jgi:DNA-binding transcriptional LysR family regulator